MFQKNCKIQSLEFSLCPARFVNKSSVDVCNTSSRWSVGAHGDETREETRRDRGKAIEGVVCLLIFNYEGKRLSGRLV